MSNEINRILCLLTQSWIFASLDLVKPIIIASCSCHLRNEEETGAEMCPTVVSYSGVITGGVWVSYWPFFPVPSKQSL